MVWLGDCLEAMTSFPADARRIGGFQLWLVQRGEEPRDWKPMPTVGLGVNEIRIHTGVEHRIVYIAKFQEAVYVLHAFEKRARRTPKGGSTWRGVGSVSCSLGGGRGNGGCLCGTIPNDEGAEDEGDEIEWQRVPRSWVLAGRG